MKFQEYAFLASTQLQSPTDARKSQECYTEELIERLAALAGVRAFIFTVHLNV